MALVKKNNTNNNDNYSESSKIDKYFAGPLLFLIFGDFEQESVFIY